MKIGVIGTGYVGLVSGVMLSTEDNSVICIDKSKDIITKLKIGECTIYENMLDHYLKSSLDNNKISFSSNYNDIKDVEALFICVGTPSSDDGSANLDYIYSSIDSSLEVVSKDCLIIIKSTVPPGSSKKFQDYIYKKGYHNKIATNPEFLREGTAIYDFQNADRIVFGIQNEQSKKILLDIYKSDVLKGTEIVFTDLTTSEMIKYVSNSFLSIKLSFINEMANLCEKIDANIHDLSKGVGLDKRIGSMFLNAGPGYGGSCFPKDTNALKFVSDKLNVKSLVLDASIESNLARYSLMAKKIEDNAGGKKIAILGMSFKAGTDDVRDSPAVEIINILSEKGYDMNCYDPASNNNFRSLNIRNTKTCKSLNEAVKDTNTIVILTEWEEFKEINLEDISKLVTNKIIIDLRNIIDRDYALKLGFEVTNIGIA